MSDWDGRQVITGFASEILDRLPEGAVAGAPQEQWGSTDPDSQCWLTGQAAGVAAALAAATGTAPKAIDVRELQHELRGQGVYLQPAGAQAAA